MSAFLLKLILKDWILFNGLDIWGQHDPNQIRRLNYH